jgi:cell wall-associated NlpC family hydrolase
VPINGVALSSVAIGSVLVWSGVKGWNLSRTMGEIITGKAPTGSEVNVLAAPDNSAGGSSATGFTANGIANDFLQYQGHAYSYGGAPGKNGTNPWDCSSSVNWVVGHDSGRAIPGYGPGQYDGTVHGPPTGSWMAWPGMTHISASEAQAGDIVVSVTHMGIVLGPNQMISALNSNLKTRITPIAGYISGEIYGRLK